MAIATRSALSGTASRGAYTGSGMTLDTSDNPSVLTPASDPPITSTASPNPAPTYTAGTVAASDYMAVGSWASYTAGPSQAPAPVGSTPVAYAAGFPTSTTTLGGMTDDS